MRARLPLFVAACAMVLACMRIANAQSTDIIIVDNLPDDSAGADAGSDAAAADVATADAAPSPDAAEQDAKPRIQIDRLGYVLPEPTVVVEAKNDRRAIEERLVAHVKYCIATRTIDPGDANTRFLYLIRAGRPHATLTTVTNDEGMHLSRFEVEVVRSVNETRPIDISEQQKIFRECVAVVPLEPRPVVTERVSFLIKAGALKLLVRDMEWLPL